MFRGSEILHLCGEVGNSVKCRHTCTGCEETDGSKGRPLVSSEATATATAAEGAAAAVVLGCENPAILLNVVPFRTAHPEIQMHTQGNDVKASSVRQQGCPPSPPHPSPVFQSRFAHHLSSGILNSRNLPQQSSPPPCEQQGRFINAQLHQSPPPPPPDTTSRPKPSSSSRQALTLPQQ